MPVTSRSPKTRRFTLHKGPKTRQPKIRFNHKTWSGTHKSASKPMDYDLKNPRCYTHDPGVGPIVVKPLFRSPFSPWWSCSGSFDPNGLVFPSLSKKKKRRKSGRHPPYQGGVQNFTHLVKMGLKNYPPCQGGSNTFYIFPRSLVEEERETNRDMKRHIHRGTREGIRRTPRQELEACYFVWLIPGYGYINILGFCIYALSNRALLCGLP